MNKNVSMEELVPLIREQIANNGKVTFTPRGISMLPMLRNNEDKITLTRAELPLKKYQIALYERTAGKYVLHRVVGVHEDGYLMRGDNQFLTERGIKDSQIIAVVSDFTRKGRRYNCSGSQFKFYSVVWVNTLALRKIFAKIIRAAGKIKRKLFRKIQMKDKESLKWIIKNGKKQIPKIVILSISNIILALVTTVLALISKYAIDAAQKAANAENHVEFLKYRNLIIVYAVFILVIIVGRLILRICYQSLTIKVQANMEMQMRSRLFEQILSRKFEKINTYHSGELMNRMTSDIKIVTDGITTIVPNLLYFVTQFIGAFAVLIFFDWKFTMLFIVAGVIVSMVTLLFRRKLKSLHKLVQETDGKVRSFFQEAIESILVVKTFGVEDKFGKKGDELQQINYDAKMKRRRISILANSGFSFVFNAGYLFALVWCAFKVCTNTMTYGTLTAVLQLITQIQTPFVNVTKVVPQYYAILASAERIIEIEEVESEEKSSEKLNAKEFYENFSKAEFENIQFNYGREHILEEGNAYFEKGDFVAIRGISGIGKSTLMKMLLGVFKPQEGSIKLYCKDESFIEASPDTRNLFSYVPQGNYLFSGTLRENILLINPEATEEEIEEALRISDIDDFVKTLPQGLDTVIGEKGLGISEGQAQRLAIARALLSKAAIILLDEATSALDAETERHVLGNIQKLNKRTCIIITHKLAALEVCNKEFIIKDKKLSFVIRK